MKIVHVSTQDIRGGAARSAYRLHQGLQRIGWPSTMFVMDKTCPDQTIVRFDPPQGFVDRVGTRMRRGAIARDFVRYQASRPSGYEMFSDDRGPFPHAMVPQIPSCDVVNLHWVAGMLDYTSFLPQMTRTTPVVWTLHDMNAFTGGCHYDNRCGRFSGSCGACPQLGSHQEQDLSRAVWERKKRAIVAAKNGRLRIVTPSRWLAEEARKSSLLSEIRVDVIPYGLDLDVFTPRDKAYSRDLLGIPQDARVVFFLADVVDNRRKGFSFLLEALPHCAKRVEKLLLVSLGQQPPQADGRMPWLHLGSIHDDRLLSAVYSAADLFVLPSLQDNLANTVLEAMACGVPVVSFNSGGTPEMVRPGITGQLVLAFEVSALAATIVEMMNAPEYRKLLSENCRRLALDEYPLQLQAERYAELYRSLVSDLAN
ncbi:MAG: glycosyltransferase family 4 protein [Nitrospira sp.]|nr:glycosyltransferase family 4 protein [Nitrospira sp.]